MRNGFGVSKQKKEVKNTTPIEFDAEMAHKLYNLLKNTKRLPRTAHAPSMTKWAKEFALLRETPNTTKDEIAAVLIWYKRHIKDEFVPLIQSAKKFRTEFDRIVDAMKRHGNELELTNTLISAKAQSIADNHPEYQWPGNESKLVPAFCQIGLDNFEVFWEAIKTLYAKLKLKADQEKALSLKAKGVYSSALYKEVNLVKCVIDQLHAGSQYVWLWLDAANFVANKYQSWDGKLLKHTFNYESDRFQLICSRFVRDFRGDGAEWYSVVWPQIQRIIKMSRKEQRSSDNVATSAAVS